MNFFFNCCTCNNKFNFQESYCESCLQRIKNDQSRVFELIQSIFDKKKVNSISKSKILELIQQPENQIQQQIDSKRTYLQSKQNQLEILKNKIQILKATVVKDNGFIDVKKKYLSTRRSALKKNKLSFESVNSSNTSGFSSLVDEIQKKKDQLLLENNSLQIIKRSKIEQLTSSMNRLQLNPTIPDHYFVFNMILNDQQLLKFPKDVIFTTLGYISKVVIMISGILGITLPYHLVFKGSKSTIHHNMKSKDYPLYYQHKTKSREFQKALYLLGENIAFLRYYHGIQTSKESNLLFLKNLYELIKSNNLGKDQQFSEIGSPMSGEYDDTKEDEWEVVTSIDEDDSFEKFVNDQPS